MTDTKIDDLTNGKVDSKKNSKYGRMDLADFVFEVERFSRLIEPISFLIYCLEDIQRWKYPIFSLILWLLCNIASLVLTKGAVFALVSLSVIFIATACLVQLHTGLLGKFLPTTDIGRPPDEDPDSDDEAMLKTVKQFRYSLLQMYDFIVQCNEHLANLYRIIRWDNTLASLRFHVVLCIFLLSLVILPTRAIFFLCINWFFLGNEDVFQTVLKLCDRSATNFMKKPNNQTIPPQRLHDLPGEGDSFEGGKSLEKTEELDNDPVNVKISADDIDKVSVANKPGMVARLMEMRKRRQHIANESCFRCEVSFASILKRRFYCRHCGNNFCSKCCNQKVPKSMFGATSPEAQTETVLVCLVCYELLMSQTNKDKVT